MILKPGKYDIQSESDPNLTYVLTVKSADVIQCGCPGWIYRRKCKHVLAAFRGEYSVAS